MKKILVIAPDSIHTKKFIDMVHHKYEVMLILSCDKSMEYNVETLILSGSFISLYRMYNAIVKFAPDIIHVHTVNKFCLFAVLLNNILFRKPIVITSWGSDVLVVPFGSAMSRLIVKYCLESADLVMYDSFIQKFTLKQLSIKCLELQEVNFGVQKELSVCDESLVKEDLIYSSRSHSANYNIDQVIHAFHRFHYKNPTFRLIIAGFPDSDITPKLYELIEELGVSGLVEMIGKVSPAQNAKLMQRAKIYVSLPSSDAKSVSIMEAIYADCIVFATDIPSNYELVVDGVNGFLSDAANVDFAKYRCIDQKSINVVNSALSKKFEADYNANIILYSYAKLLGE